MEQNAFLYASVPVRMLLGALAAVRVGMGGVRREEREVLWMVAGYDGFGGESLFCFCFFCFFLSGFELVLVMVNVNELANNVFVLM